jgi:holin-like protein
MVTPSPDAPHPALRATSRRTLVRLTRKGGRRVSSTRLDLCTCRGEASGMVRGFFVLVLCQLVGEVLARGFDLPAPGPVIGLALLTAGLAAWRRWHPMSDDELANSDIGRTAAALLGSLSLLFVPAGVGVVQYGSLFSEYGVALAVSLVISTVAALLATVGVFVHVKQRMGVS